MSPYLPNLYIETQRANLLYEPLFYRDGKARIVSRLAFSAEPDIVLADMVSIGLLGYISDRLIVMLADWLLKWRRLQSFNQ